MRENGPARRCRSRGHASLARHLSHCLTRPQWVPSAAQSRLSRLRNLDACLREADGQCRAGGGAAHDRAPCRPAGGDHAGRRQGLRCRGFRQRVALDAVTPQRGAELQRRRSGSTDARHAMPASGCASGSKRPSAGADRAAKDQVPRPRPRRRAFTFAAAAYDLVRPPMLLCAVP